MSAPIITPRFALSHVSDELDRAVEEFSFAIHGMSAAIEDSAGFNNSDGAIFCLMSLRDRLEGLSSYALSVVKAQIGEGQL